MSEITPEELIEAKRLIVLQTYPTYKPEDYTCYNCNGKTLLSKNDDLKLEQDYLDVRQFNPNAKTVCSLAWDAYNTTGDCLASK